MPTVGILGAGQLAQMLAQSGKKLDCTFSFLDPSPTACAFPLGLKILGKYDDPELLEKLAEHSDVVTFEFENVPHLSVEVLSQHITIHPPARALEISQDRFKEKTTFEFLSIPTTKFFAIDDENDFRKAVRKLGFPCVVKTRSEGYDGKGQRVLRKEDDVGLAWKELGNRSLIVEEFIFFDREVSIIAARNKKGEIACYDICQNEHHNGILRFTKNMKNDLAFETAKTYAKKLLEHMEYIGVFTLELFDKKGILFANEIAPRVHNSGHWTIEGARTSQFENHLRAILDLPLGSTESIGYSVMANVIGSPLEERLLSHPEFHVHMYGKESRPGRKIGHITVVSKDAKSRESFKEILQKITFSE